MIFGLDIYSHWTVYLALAVLLLSILLPALAKRARLRRVFRGIPGPDARSYPLIGHALSLRGNQYLAIDGMLGWCKKHIEKGHEVGHFWLGPTPLVLVFGPNSAEVLLHSSKHIEKMSFYRSLQSWLGKGLLTSGGEKWKARRKLLTPTFHFSILQEFLVVMNEQAGVLVSKLEDLSGDCEPFDISRHITLCALDIICETAMGKSIQAQRAGDSEYARAVSGCAELMVARQKSPWLWPDVIYSCLNEGKSYYRHLKILHDFTRSVIAEKKQNFKPREKLGGKKRLAFLDLLLEVSDDGKVLSAEDIREEVDTFMFAGHDTTAAAMTWATHLIGTHKDVQRKIQEELDAIFEGDLERNITKNDLNKMEYLDMVLKESMRLLPVVTFVGRVTSKDCLLDGHSIPEGTQCIISPRMLNRNRRFWKDPDDFIPERFTAENCVGRHPYAYIPFSAGPRNCIGQKFAMMEQKVILAHILRKFTVTSNNKLEDLKPTPEIVMRPKAGLPVTLEPRVFEHSEQ